MGAKMKLDRLMGILIALLQNDRTTAPVLAEKFEVSRRTINRDIETLCQAGIPIVTWQGGRGGISIAEGYRLDKSVLTTEELTGIIAGIKGLATVSERTQIERTLDKLTPCRDAVISLKENIVIDLASHYKGSLTDKIESIKRAIGEDRIIEFTYYYDKGEGQRRMEPYFITFQWSAWYVFGYCLTRCDWRLFKLARLWDLKLCEERFCRREIPEERKDFNARFTDHLKLTAVFDPSVKFQLLDSYGPDSFTQEEDGTLRLEIGYTDFEYTLRWLLAFGDKVRVLEPREMRERILAISENLIAAYKGT